MQEFPLTIDQAREFFEGEQKRTGNLKAPVGESCAEHSCPLVMAYLHFHPGVRVSIGLFTATIDGVDYITTTWQKDFVDRIDAPVCYNPIPADRALAVLERVTKGLGDSQ